MRRGIKSAGCALQAGLKACTTWIAALLLTAGCEVGDSHSYRVIPGPTVPSPTPTSAPYVWDTREELAIWVNNAVTRGPAPISLVDEGGDSFVRIEVKRGLDNGWVLRGPDLTTPARLRGLRIRYRWKLDPTLSPGASRTFTIIASFDVLNPQYQPQQPMAYAQLQPAVEWSEGNLEPGSFGDPLNVRYVYLHQSSSNPGVFEIDRIELVQ